MRLSTWTETAISVAQRGTVTAIGRAREMAQPSLCSDYRGRSFPWLGCLGPEGPERAAGDEVAAKGDRVVDRSMRGKEALG